MSENALRIRDKTRKTMTKEGKAGRIMRIEAYNAVNQIYSAKKPQQVNKANKSRSYDQVQISSLGKDLQVAKQAVKEASDIRKEVTEPLKASINAGTYSVSEDDFASKLLAKFDAKF